MSKQENIALVKIHCNKCNGETSHRVVAERKLKGSEKVPNEDYVVSWEDTYTMLECCGCNDVTMRRVNWFSEYEDNDVEYFPPRISRPIPRWHNRLPDEFASLMKEIYTAIQADSRRLAIMGTRSLVDMFMNDKVGDIGGFYDKLAQLVKQGFLSEKHKNILEAALEAGHAVTHRGFQPKSDTVKQVVDIVENLLNTSYILDEDAQDLKRDTPARKKKQTDFEDNKKQIISSLAQNIGMVNPDQYRSNKSQIPVPES